MVVGPFPAGIRGEVGKGVSRFRVPALVSEQQRLCRSDRFVLRIPCERLIDQAPRFLKTPRAYVVKMAPSDRAREFLVGLDSVVI